MRMEIDRKTLEKEISLWFDKYGYSMSDRSRGIFDGLLGKAMVSAEGLTEQFYDPAYVVIMALVVEQQKALSRLSK